MVMKRKLSLGLRTVLVQILLLSAVFAQPCPAPASMASQQNVDQVPVNTSGALGLFDLKEMQLYENVQNGFSLSYPAGWIAQEAGPNDQGIVVGFLAPGEDVNAPSIYVVVQIEKLPAGQKLTLQQYTQSALNNFKTSQPNLAIQNETEISIGDTPGHAIAYNLSSSGVEYDVVNAWTVKGDRAFIFTYNTPSDRYDEFAGDVDKIIGSLK
ncbi:MAG: PsbP-related protein [Methanothrix sp.]|nr:PsbP-related protein [Methanothrix sp.]